MRILFVTNAMTMGGVETNLVRLSRELTARGHDVTAAAGAGVLVPDLAAAGARFVELHSGRRPGALLADTRTLAQAIRDTECDVIHVFSAASAVLTALARFRARRLPPGQPVAPVVSSIMGLHGSPGESDLRVRARIMLTALGARKIVVMAPAIDAYVQSLPIRRRRLTHRSVVGVDLPVLSGDAARRAEVRRELQVPDGGKLVLTIGRLDLRKSHELFVRAAAELATERPRDRFFVVGDGSQEPRLQAEIARLGVGDRVGLLGHRNDVDRLLSATDVYVRPGIVEGFIGITVLEAQALEVPVVSFDTEDVQLAVADERTGLLVPRGDVHGLATAIGRLLDDEALAGRLGAAGRLHVERTYGLGAVVDGMEQLYADVVTAGGGG